MCPVSMAHRVAKEKKKKHIRLKAPRAAAREGRYTPPQMAAAIRAISGVDDTVTAFSQINAQAVAYLAASAVYDNSGYTGEVISQYDDDAAANEKPLGYALTIKSAGTIYFLDETTGNGWNDAVSVGTYTAYNLTPNHVWRYWVKDSNGTTTQTGRLMPTGDLRMIYLQYPHNWRDLGGWACDGGKLRYGLLYRGAQLHYNNGMIASASDIQRLRKLGIRYEIDLRTLGQTAGQDEQTGTADDITYSVLGNDVYYLQFPYSDASYTAIVDPNGTYGEQTRKLMRQIVDNVIHGEPTYFHCQAGADRTGVIAAMVEGVCGVSRPDLDRDYEITSFYPSYHRTRLDTNWVALTNYINGIEGSTLRDKFVQWFIGMGFTIAELNAFRAALIDGTPDILDEDDYDVSYTVTRNLANGITTNNAASSVERNASYAANITADTANNVAIKNVTVTMGGVDITEDVVTLTPYTPTPPIVTAYTVTNSLTNVSNSNSAQTVSSGNSYTATLTPSSGYAFTDVEIQMGGVDITATVYSSGTINIPNVTGNIVIYATATQAVRTNQLPLAVDTDGSPYNGGQGWKAGYRLNSNGAEAAQSGAFVTGFMPFKQGDTMELENIGLPANANVTNHSYCYIALYDASKTKIVSNYAKDVMAQSDNHVSSDSNGYVTQWTLNRWLSSSQDLSGVAFVRLSALAMDSTSKVYIE